MAGAFRAEDESPRMDIVRATVTGLAGGAVIGGLFTMGAVTFMGASRDDSAYAYVATGIGISMFVHFLMRLTLEKARTYRARKPALWLSLTMAAALGVTGFWLRAMLCYATGQHLDDHGAFEGLWSGVSQALPVGILLGASLGYWWGRGLKPAQPQGQESELA